VAEASEYWRVLPGQGSAKVSKENAATLRRCRACNETSVRQGISARTTGSPFPTAAAVSWEGRRHDYAADLAGFEDELRTPETRRIMGRTRLRHPQALHLLRPYDGQLIVAGDGIFTPGSAARFVDMAESALAPQSAPAGCDISPSRRRALQLERCFGGDEFVEVCDTGCCAGPVPWRRRRREPVAMTAM